MHGLYWCQSMRHNKLFTLHWLSWSDNMIRHRRSAQGRPSFVDWLFQRREDGCATNRTNDALAGLQRASMHLQYSAT